MNNRELKYIIEAIKAGEGKELAAIAGKAKVNRSHLSTLINSNDIKEVTDSFVGKIRKHYPAYFKQEPTPTGTNIEANLKAIAQALDRLENGQYYIRAEVRGYGQYQIQHQVAWDQQKFLAAMERVGMIIGANLQAGELRGKSAVEGKTHRESDS
jgi:hypothetical protein